MKQYASLGDTVYFWFAANDTSGSGGDGSSPACVVRLAGAASDAAPVYSPTPVLLSHASYPAGCYEVAIPATSGNGFATNNTYAVFCTLAIDSQNPTGFVGSFDLKPVKADVASISGDTTAADNLESQYDGTGLIGDNYPANQKQVGLISSGAAAIATTAESATITTGTETGTYTNTVESDETFHIVEPSGGVTDFYYQFDIGPNALPVGIDWEGYANGQGDEYESYAWNWTSSSWEQIGTCEGINGTSLRTMSRILTAAHVGTSGGDVGKVRFRIYSTTGSKIATDRLLCTYSIVAPTTDEINAEVADVLKIDTVAEMSQGAPPATPTMEQILNYLYRKFRNKTETTSTEDAVYDNAGTTKLFKATISDNGTTFTKGEYESGA